MVDDARLYVFRGGNAMATPRACVRAASCRVFFDDNLIDRQGRSVYAMAYLSDVPVLITSNTA